MDRADNEPRLKKACKKTRPEPQPVQKKSNKKKNYNKSFVVEMDFPPSSFTSSAEAGPSSSSASTSRSTPHVNRRRLLTTSEPQDPPATAAPAAPTDDTASCGSRYNTRSSAARRRRGAAHTPPVSTQQLRPPAPVACRAPPAHCDRLTQTDLVQLTNEEVDLIHAIRQRRSLSPNLCALNVGGDWFFIYNPEYNGNRNQRPRTIREYINWEPPTGSSAFRDGISDLQLLRYMPEGARRALTNRLTSIVTRMHPRRPRRRGRRRRDHDAAEIPP